MPHMCSSPKIFISPFKGGSTSIAVALDMVGFKRWDSVPYFGDNWILNLHQIKQELILIEEANKLMENIGSFKEINSKISNKVDALIGKNLRELLGDYDVADDYPLGHDEIHPFIKKIVFKEAKFIFSERPLEEYFDSVRRHILNIKYKHVYGKMRKLFRVEYYLAKKTTIEKYKKWKSNYIDLKNSFPNDVLIMDLEDEWEPLSCFLKFKVPEIEFPKFNISDLKEDTCVYRGCGHELSYCEIYDSEYCPICVDWRDELCGEKNCSLCKKRPEKPINLEAN